MRERYYPLNSLKEGHWFKLICGASFQHLPTVRNLTLAYTLAGVDCIDVAADPAAIAAAKEAVKVASKLKSWAKHQGFGYQARPWIMVSINDGEDPHFRKAEFDPAICPTDCWRPCEKVCPAEAIVFSENRDGVIPDYSGVIDELCYGCGRCLSVCPNQLIQARSYVSTPSSIASLVLPTGVDAIEIHTQVGRETDFQRLWKSIKPWVNQLKLIAISCPDGEGLIEYLQSLYEIISPLPCALIWQTDGKPMSGDIGAGTTVATIKLSQKVLDGGLPGYVQLAGGTNNSTIAKLMAAGLLANKNQEQDKDPTNNLSTPISENKFVAGVAYGSYARVLLSPILEKLEKMHKSQLQAIEFACNKTGVKVKDVNQNQINNSQLTKLETVPEILSEAVSLANSLVSQIKRLEIGKSLN
ncbi:MAG: 4Fe-4S ferredoxin [Okeania sp. SIO2F4]|uniref:circadian clock protein LdpA n=1 Tax=Okeania sp. SIO2F4 TaxID=2607790 RepID=UPI0014294391|nr:LdpA C-terminal domain-containing domain [Okeania sp. SIO2F4]NES04080.1 4Fe-4S ferredoxin [Okeania sp. SIO2F4]